MYFDSLLYKINCSCLTTFLWWRFTHDGLFECRSNQNENDKQHNGSYVIKDNIVVQELYNQKSQNRKKLHFDIVKLSLKIWGSLGMITRMIYIIQVWIVYTSWSCSRKGVKLDKEPPRGLIFVLPDNILKKLVLGTTLLCLYPASYLLPKREANKSKKNNVLLCF